MDVFQAIAENLDKAFRRAPNKNGIPSKSFIEYLSLIYTREEADTLQYMKGYPGFLTTLQIAEKSSKTTEEIEIVLSGVLKKNGITRMGNTWSLPPVTLLLNLCSGLSTAPFNEKRAAELYEKFYIEDGYYKFYQGSEKGTPFLRSLPVNKAISPGEKILKSEEAHELISNLNHDDIVLAPCPCRKRKEDLNERDCKDKNPVGSCIFLGVSAIQMESAGVGRRVSKNEAIDYFDDMHSRGLVGATDNMIRDNMIICLCCGCCCSNLRGRIYWNNPSAVAPSNFIPEPDENCVHCGICSKKCWLSAIAVDTKKKTYSLDQQKCIGCGVCTGQCPKKALKMKRQERAKAFPSQDALYKRIAKENNRPYL